MSTEDIELVRDVELLLRTMARALYDDTSVVVINSLLRDKFWKQDGHGKFHTNLRLPNKVLRKTLAFLQTEHLVACERVSRIVETSDSRRTYRREKNVVFWYLDYNRAVHTIRFRIHKKKETLQEKVKTLSSQCTFQCPTCQELSTELDVQSYPMHKNSFLCFRCYKWHVDNPDAPDIQSYTLQVVDHSEELRQAETILQRINTQLREATISGSKLRNGVFDILRRIQNRKKTIPCNLPSENGAAAFLGRMHPATDAVDDDGVIRTTNSQGEQVELCMQPGKSLQAYQLSLHSVDALEAAVVASQTKRQTTQNLKRASVPANIPKPKAACRQTTPFFLKDNIAQSERAMRSLSIGETSISGSRSPPADYQEVVSDGDEPQGEPVNFFWSYRQEKERQEKLLFPDATGSGLAGELFLSADSNASVNWEEG